MRVTSVQLHERPGELLDAAQREPVVITKHNREHAVIVSAVYFRSMQGALRQARLTESLTPEEIELAKAAAVPSEEEQAQFLRDLAEALNAEQSEAAL